MGEMEERLDATQLCPLGPNLVSSWGSPAGPWSLIPSSLVAEPGWLLGPQSLLLPSPQLGTPSLSLSLFAPFWILFDMPLIQ